jgi:hypothetical protein
VRLFADARPPVAVVRKHGDRHLGGDGRRLNDPVQASTKKGRRGQTSRSGSWATCVRLGIDGASTQFIGGRRARLEDPVTCFSTTKLLVLAAVSLATVGCGTPDFGLSALFHQPCTPEVCPVIDEDAGPNDARIEIPAGQVVIVSLTSSNSVQETRGGEVVLAEDLSCVPSVGAPCKATLKRLRIELVAIDFPTDQGNFHAQDIVVSYQAPLSIEGDGTDFALPSGSTVHTCVNVEGVSEHASATTTMEGSLMVSTNDQTLSFNAVLPLIVKLGSDCSVFPMQIAGDVDGATPWAQRPGP